MRRRARTTGQAIMVLLMLTVLLASCWGGCTTSPTAVMGDFGGKLSDPNFFIALSTDGQMLSAAITNGTSTQHPTHQPSFQGPVTNNKVNLEAAAGASLSARLTSSYATGTVTFTKNGTPYSFTAKKDFTDPPIQPGLYQGEQTVGGVRYLADWIVLSSTAASTKSQAQREGIINEQTGALIRAPALTYKNIASMQVSVSVPGLGVVDFPLMLYRSGELVAIPPPTQMTVTPSPVLSVSPGSFSLPKDPNCSFDSKASLWNCTATLTNSGQSDLNWSASSNPPGVPFSPFRGLLPAGQTRSVIIFLPGPYCASSTLIFKGPGNSVSVSVSCPPKPSK